MHFLMRWPSVPQRMHLPSRRSLAMRSERMRTATCWLPVSASNARWYLARRLSSASPFGFLSGSPAFEMALSSSPSVDASDRLAPVGSLVLDSGSCPGASSAALLPPPERREAGIRRPDDDPASEREIPPAEHRERAEVQP